MKHAEKGIGGLQLLALVATMGIASLIAVPNYEVRSNHDRISEALDLAAQSVRNVSQAYLESGSFPRSPAEARAMLTDTGSMPDFVKAVDILSNPSGNSVMITVLFNDGVFENEFGVEQYLFLEGRRSQDAMHEIKWSCGTGGIDLKYLPGDCHV